MHQSKHPAVPPALKEGYITDFVSGELVKETPAEVEAVQVFSRQLVEDYGYSKEQLQTRPQMRHKAKSPDASKDSFPDIVVFSNTKKKEPIIIAACRKKDRKDGRDQLEGYLRHSPAELGVWFNGTERLFLRKLEKGSKVTFEEIPNIPLAGQRVEDIGRFRRQDLKTTHNLKAIFRAIRNYLAANTIGATRDEVLARQLINLLFCKLYDEKHTAPQDMVRFRAGIHEKTALIVQRITELFEEVKANMQEVIEAEEKLALDNASIVYVVGELQNYSLTSSERDVIADAFEVFIGHALKGGQGQFFTPRNVVRMIVDMIAPAETDKIIDPSCGSGGFLIDALRYVWARATEKYTQLGWPEDQIEERKKEIAANNFRGIDKDYFLSKVAKAYLHLVSNGATGIFCEDSLERPAAWKKETQAGVEWGSFDVIITNPPFGSRIPVTGEDKLKQYELGHKWKYDTSADQWYKTSILKEQEEPQVLFIERCFELLKEGGRMAMVLPDGILGNEQQEYVRRYILEKGSLFAIVDLPIVTFSPNVTIKTSVLFIQKGKKARNDKVFISLNEYCGHDKKGRPVPEDDIIHVFGYYATQQSNGHNFFIDKSVLEPSFIAKRYLQKYVDNLLKINSSRHAVIAFEKIMEKVHNGANISDASIYAEKGEGIPYILVSSITKEGIDFENLKYIKKSLKTDKEVIKNTVNEHSIVMTRAGNSGIAANIPPDLVGGVASGFLINITIKKEVNPYYIVSFLNSQYGQMQLERISSGSILQSIRSSDLKKVQIILPKKEIQDQIGNKIKEAVYAKAAGRKSIAEADKDIVNLVSPKNRS